MQAIYQSLVSFKTVGEKKTKTKNKTLAKRIKGKERKNQNKQTKNPPNKTSMKIPGKENLSYHMQRNLSKETTKKICALFLRLTNHYYEQESHIQQVASIFI